MTPDDVLCALALAGTLITVIPTRDGTVVGADSNGSSLLGIVVSNRIKLHTIPGNDRTVFTITGTSEFVPLPPTNTDMAAWLQSAPPLFSGENVVSNVLARAGDGIITQSVLEASGKSLADALEAFFKLYPQTQAIPADHRLCQTLVVQFDRPTRTTIMASYRVDVFTNWVLAVNDCKIVRISADHARDIWMFGESDYAATNVLTPGSFGWQFLVDTEFPALWLGANSVEDMLSTNAAKMSTLVIHATEMTSRIVPIRNAVGGPPMVLLIDGNGPPRSIK